MRTIMLAFVFLVLAACARETDAEAVRRTIHEMAAAVDDGDAGELLEHVAEDFTGNDGALDRDDVAKLVRAQLLTRSVAARLGSIEVELFGDRATARFSATLTDTSSRWIPTGRAELRFVTGWRRDGGEWRCYNAGWERDD